MIAPPINTPIVNSHMSYLLLLTPRQRSGSAPPTSYSSARSTVQLSLQLLRLRCLTFLEVHPVPVERHRRWALADVRYVLDATGDRISALRNYVSVNVEAGRVDIDLCDNRSHRAILLVVVKVYHSADRGLGDFVFWAVLPLLRGVPLVWRSSVRGCISHRMISSYFGMGGGEFYFVDFEEGLYFLEDNIGG